MKTKRALLVSGLVALALAVAGCTTLHSRIDRNRAAFNTWPPAVQDKIVAGQIDVGFTADQVRVAIGEPDRVWTRTTGDGTSQIWSYSEPSPRYGWGFGIGMGSWGPRSGRYGAIGVGSGYREDEKVGVIFDAHGQVSAIETRQR